MADIETIGWSSALALGATTLGGIVAKAIDYSVKKRNAIQAHEDTLIERFQKRIEALEGHVKTCNDEMQERVLEIGGLRKDNEHLTAQVKDLRSQLDFLKGQK